jgi:hypothetical protein
MPGEDVPLRDHLEATTAIRLEHLQERWSAHEAVHDQEAQTRDESARRIDQRLEQLNELRSEVLTDRERLVNRDVFDARAATVDARIDALKEQIIEWRGREKGLSLSASLLVGAVGFIATLVAVYFALN